MHKAPTRYFDEARIYAFNDTELSFSRLWLMRCLLSSLLCVFSCCFSMCMKRSRLSNFHSDLLVPEKELFEHLRRGSGIWKDAWQYGLSGYVAYTGTIHTMTLTISKCCFTVYERFFDGIIGLFVPFYNELKSIIYIFQILTRARVSQIIELCFLLRFQLIPYRARSRFTCMYWGHSSSRMLQRLIGLWILHPWWGTS